MMSAAEAISEVRRKGMGEPPKGGLNVRWVSDLALSGEVRSVADVQQKGLTVRSGPRKTQYMLVWSTGGQKHRLTLGLVPELTLAEARKIVRKGLDLLEQGLVPDENWVRRERSPVAPALVVQQKTWTYAEARNLYLEEVAGTRKPATHTDYRKCLCHDVMRPFESRFVADITEEEISEALAAYRRDQKNGAAKGLKRRLSPFWKFMQRADNRKASGVLRRIQIDLPGDFRGVTKQLRFPHPSLVRQLLVMAQEERLGAASKAVELLCLTAQRRETVVTAKYEDLHEGKWFIPPVHRKTAEKNQDNRIHLLPLPPRMHQTNYPDHFWTFPAARPRRKGDPVGHMASSTITHAFADAGLGFSPHDVRRSFTTAMKIYKIPEADIDLILDHNEGPNTTTSTHYDIFRDLPKKQVMMDLWWSLMRGDTEISEDVWNEHTGKKPDRKRAKMGPLAKADMTKMAAVREASINAVVADGPVSLAVLEGRAL